MGKTAAKEHLSRILNTHLNTIHDTFQILDQTPAESVDKVSWNDVVQIGEQVSKHATTAGMLWTGETLEMKSLEENMASYFNILQGFLLLSHGSMVGAGPTLSSCIHASVKRVVDCSFVLLKESVSSFGSRGKEKKLSIPQLVGTVWEAFSALKKTPSNNITAIGRAMTQVAVSMKDVLRELEELKPASSDSADETSDEVPVVAQCKTHDSDNSCEDELGNDLSPEEMKIVHLTTDVVSKTLAAIKELIRSITGLLKQENSNSINNIVDSLERLLKLTQEIGVQIDELGACLYPPQEIPAIKASLEKLSAITDEMQAGLENLKGSSETFIEACTTLRNSLRQLQSELCCSNATVLVPKLESLVMSN